MIHTQSTIRSVQTFAAHNKKKVLFALGALACFLVLPGAASLDDHIAPSHPPEARQTIRVHNQGELQRALNDADSGDHIVLANGNYERFTVSQSGVVVRADTLLQATVRGGIEVRGSNVWIYGLTITNDGIEVEGRDVVIARNHMTNLRDYGVRINGPNASVVYNEISNTIGGVIVGNRSATGATIAFNFIHDRTNHREIAILVGSGRSTHEARLNANVHHNLITNWGFHNCIELKSAHNTITANTLIGDDASCTINNRHGADNTFSYNWVERGGILASDYRTRVIGNVLRNSREGLAAKAGNVSPDNYADRPGQYVAAVGTVFQNNDTDRFTLNWCNDTSCSVRVRNVSSPDAESDGRRSEASSRIQRLTPSDVGPRAGNASRGEGETESSTRAARSTVTEETRETRSVETENSSDSDRNERTERNSNRRSEENRRAESSRNDSGWVASTAYSTTESEESVSTNATRGTDGADGVSSVGADGANGSNAY